MVTCLEFSTCISRIMGDKQEESGSRRRKWKAGERKEVGAKGGNGIERKRKEQKGMEEKRLGEVR